MKFWQIFDNYDFRILLDISKYDSRDLFQSWKWKLQLITSKNLQIKGISSINVSRKTCFGLKKLANIWYGFT